MKKIKDILTENLVFGGLLVLVLGVPVIFSPYTQSNVYLIKTVFLQCSVFTLFIFWLARKFLAKESFHRIPLVIPLLAFLGLGLFSLVLSPFRYAVGEEFLRFLSFFIFYFLIVAEIKDDRREALLMDILVLTAILVSLYGIIQRLGFPIFKWIPQETRVMSFFGNPNFFATYLVAVIPLLLVLTTQWTKRRKFFAGIALASTLACLVFAATRSAWIGFVFSLIFLGVLGWRTNVVVINLKKSIPLFVIICGIIIIIILNHDMIIKRIAEFGNPHGSASQRWYIWKVTWNMIKSSPVVGSGLGTFPIFFPKFRYPNFGTDIPYGNLQHTHNEYLEIWSEMGLIGLGIFLWFFIGFFIYAVRYLRSRKEQGIMVVGLLSGIMGVLIDSFFSASMRFTGPPFTFWLLIGLTMAIARPKGITPVRNIKETRGKLTQFAVISGVVICSILITLWHIKKYEANIHIAKAQAFIHRDFKTNAIYEFKEALNHDPHGVLSLYLLGCLSIETENFNEAKKWFEKLENLSPDFSNIHEWKGYLFYRLGDLAKAEEEFKICARLKPSVFDHNMLGRIYSLQGKWDQAIEEIEQADELGITSGKDETNMSVSRSSSEDLDQSSEVQSTAGGELPKSFEDDEITNTKIMLAHAYYMRGKFDKAIQKLDETSEETLSEKQRNVAAQLYCKIAQKYAQRGENLDQALKFCQRSFALNSSHPELIFDTKAWIYFKMGNTGEAKHEIEKALNIAPDSVSFKNHLSIIDKAIKGK